MKMHKSLTHVIPKMQLEHPVPVDLTPMHARCWTRLEMYSSTNDETFVVFKNYVKLLLR